MPAHKIPARQLILDFPALPDHTFANFAVSNGSRFAFDAAQAFCSPAAPACNALYLSGGKNLGKTHLLIAIGNQVAATAPARTALYLNCGDFIRKVAENDDASLHAAVSRLTAVDYLLLDGIEGICGHPAAQEKLYFIYNALMERGKKIAFAGAVKPGRLDAEPFLKSRFQWGLTAELGPIDDETAARIIGKLGADLGLAIPEKIVVFLLNRIPRDFPSLKCAVAAINMESYAQKKKVTVPLVKMALNLPPAADRPPAADGLPAADRLPEA